MNPPLLVQRQILGEGSLDKLASDIKKISSENLRSPSAIYSVQVDGEKRQFNLVAAMIDVVLAGLYKQANGRTTQQGFVAKLEDVLTAQDGYLAFDAQSLGDQVQRGIQSLREYIVSSTWGASINPAMLEKSRWGVQNGSQLSYVGSDFDVRSDVVVTLHGSNSIKVGGGDDLVLAGDGDDDISGGSGNDRLHGGGWIRHLSLPHRRIPFGKCRPHLRQRW
ncbi:hypothetical protein [Xanthomonas hortorum]|uniref:hypothetical protein n=1 Tax=Xanthomonas hortorum TaxID=56454 RepID=UPI001F456644|nr:hypothetical protein [Xanthomonas hortorum]MCE4365064.1 hypothetical protein [Xanthomonas hortorum]